MASDPVVVTFAGDGRLVVDDGDAMAANAVAEDQRRVDAEVARVQRADAERAAAACAERDRIARAAQVARVEEETRLADLERERLDAAQDSARAPDREMFRGVAAKLRVLLLDMPEVASEAGALLRFEIELIVATLAARLEAF